MIRARILPSILWILLSCVAASAHAQSAKSCDALARASVVFSGQFPRFDLVDAKRPKIGLRGRSALTLPTMRAPSCVLRFGYQANGWRSNLKVGDDRDPQHGFRWMLSIDGAGRVALSGAKQTLQLVPNRYYVFELRWSWSTKGLRIEEVRVAENQFGQHNYAVLKSTELRSGRRGTTLRIEHSGLGSCWLDRLGISKG